MTNGGTKKLVWIGVVGVIPQEGCELISAERGAYTNFLTLAANEAEYRSKVADVLSYYKLQLLEFNDIRPFSEADDPEDDILQIAREMEDQQNPKHVRYATFYTFPRKM